MGQVESGHCGQPGETGGERGQFKPRSEESGGLGALARGDYCEHRIIVS